MKEGKTFPPTNENYSISLEEIKRYNLFEVLERLGAHLDKKKSSRYGRLYKTDYGKIWARYDYSTGFYFYINLSDDTDKGTLIDFIQNHLINDKNLGKVKRYFIDYIRQ